MGTDRLAQFKSEFEEISRLREEADERYRQVCAELIQEVSELTRRTRELEKALRPFADFVTDQWDNGQDDSLVVTVGERLGPSSYLLLSDFKRARQVVGTTQEHQKAADSLDAAIAREREEVEGNGWDHVEDPLVRQVRDRGRRDGRY